MNYKELLKSPKWQKKRLEVFERDGFKCTSCGDEQTQLQVHHLKYMKNPIEQPIGDLKTVCKDCYELITGLKLEFKGGICKNNVKYLFYSDYILIKNKNYMVSVKVEDLKEVLNG